MSVEKLELLEERLMKVVKLVSDLKEKNASLETRVVELQKELAARSEDLSKYQEENKVLAQVQSKNSLLTEEREKIRLKIENMLNNLERIDIV